MSTEIVVNQREKTADALLAVVQKLSGKGWFNGIQSELKEKFLAVIPEVQLSSETDELSPAMIKPEDYMLLSEECNDTKSQLEAVQKQLLETVEAHDTVGKEYQAAHKALIDIAIVLIGKEAVLKQAPLTIEKLYGIITEQIVGLGAKADKADAASSSFDVVTWAKNRQKNLVMVGHGPLTMGRFEGEKDILTQLLHSAKKGK